MVAGRQPGYERGHDSRIRVDDDDARTAVLAAAVGRLVRIGGKQPPALEASFERDIDRRPFGLKAGALCVRFAQRSGDFAPVLVEDKDVGGKRVCRIELAATK
jgi:hypothetical protein